MAETDLTNAIAENAAGPARVSADGVSVEGQSVAEQIAADRYLAGKAAQKRKHWGLRFMKILHPGTA